MLSLSTSCPPSVERSIDGRRDDTPANQRIRWERSTRSTHDCCSSAASLLRRRAARFCDRASAATAGGADARRSAAAGGAAAGAAGGAPSACAALSARCALLQLRASATVRSGRLLDASTGGAALARLRFWRSGCWVLCGSGIGAGCGGSAILVPSAAGFAVRWTRRRIVSGRGRTGVIGRSGNRNPDRDCRRGRRQRHEPAEHARRRPGVRC